MIEWKAVLRTLGSIGALVGFAGLCYIYVWIIGRFEWRGVLGLVIAQLIIWLVAEIYKDHKRALRREQERRQ